MDVIRRVMNQPRIVSKRPFGVMTQVMSGEVAFLKVKKKKKNSSRRGFFSPSLCSITFALLLSRSRLVNDGETNAIMQDRCRTAKGPRGICHPDPMPLDARFFAVEGGGALEGLYYLSRWKRRLPVRAV